MTGITRGLIDRSVDDEYSGFSEVFGQTAPSLFDFYDRSIMTNPEMPSMCQRIMRYLDATDSDSLFAAEAGIHFATTIAGLANFKTDQTLAVLSDILAGYERMEYCSAIERVRNDVDQFYEANPNIFGVTEAYLAIDTWVDEEADFEFASNDPARLAGMVSAALTFMALEERAAMASVDMDILNLLENSQRHIT